MKKEIIYFAIFVFLLLSCTSQKGIHIDNSLRYETNEKYKNLYIVDTIQIDTPVRFFTKSGYEFIMSKKKFDLFKGSEKDLFGSNNAFLAGNLPMGLPPAKFNKYFVSGDCYKLLELSSEKKKDIKTVYFYKTNPNFLLLLVNADYFNSAFIGIDGAPAIRDKRKSFIYYKVIIPICIP